MAEATEEPEEEAPAAPEPEAAAAAEPAPTEEAPPVPPIAEFTDPTPAEAAALEAAGEAPPPPPQQYGSPPQDGMYQQPAVYNVAPMAQYTIQALAGRTVEFKLLLPHAACGIVIGKGGAMVSHIRDASGCQVDVQESPAPPPMAGGVQGGSERIITLSGDFGSVYAAFQMVLQHLAAAQPADPLLTTRPPGSVEAVVLVPRNKTGGLIGRGGASINRVRQDSGATVKVGAPEDVVAGDPDVRKCIVSGAVEQVMAAFTLIVHKLEETPAGAARAADAPPMAQGYAQNPYVQPYAGQAMPAQLAPGTMPVQFQVPNESMGAVIGRAGATINQIRSMSGAKVDIAQSVPGMPMRLVTVTGTPDQIQMAQYLIQVKMGGGSLPQAGQMAARGLRADAAAADAAAAGRAPAGPPPAADERELRAGRLRAADADAAADDAAAADAAAADAAAAGLPGHGRLPGLLGSTLSFAPFARAYLPSSSPSSRTPSLRGPRSRRRPPHDRTTKQ